MRNVSMGLEIKVEGTSKRESRSSALGIMALTSSVEGRNSPHATGSPTTFFLSRTRTRAPPRAAYSAVVLPAGPAPTITTS